MEKENIIKEIHEINDCIAHLYRLLDDANDPMNNFGYINREQETRINNKIQNLNNIKNTYYKTLYEYKLILHRDILNNPVIKGLIGNDYYFNYLLICLLEKAPIIYQNDTITKIVYYFIKNNKRFNALNILSKIEEKVFENRELLSVINTNYFNNLQEIFYSNILMNDNNFVQFLLSKLKTKKNDSNYSLDIKNMERALQAKLDYELVWQIGYRKFDCEKSLDYFEENSGVELLDSIAAIKNIKFKKYLLSILFCSTDMRKINILEKFFNIKEIRDQLLNPNSFYYQFLILPQFDNLYGTKEALFHFDSQIFEDFDFQKMIHYFDSRVSHYIYYYDHRKIVRVPILAYIATIHKKINTYCFFIDSIYSADIDLSTEDLLVEKYKDILTIPFVGMCIDSLSENENKSLPKDEIAYWDYLMKQAFEDEVQNNLKI